MEGSPAGRCTRAAAGPSGQASEPRCARAAAVSLPLGDELSISLVPLRPLGRLAQPKKEAAGPTGQRLRVDYWRPRRDSKLQYTMRFCPSGRYVRLAPLGSVHPRPTAANSYNWRARRLRCPSSQGPSSLVALAWRCLPSTRRSGICPGVVENQSAARGRPEIILVPLEICLARYSRRQVGLQRKMGAMGLRLWRCTSLTISRP